VFDCVLASQAHQAMRQTLASMCQDASKDRRLDPAGRSFAGRIPPDGARGRAAEGPSFAEGVAIIVLPRSPVSVALVCSCWKSRNMSLLKSTLPVALRQSKRSLRSVTKRWNSVSQRPGSDRYIVVYPSCL
jgi:hypothetical protein